MWCYDNRSSMVIVYSPRCLDYAAAGHPENPDRVRSAVAQLHKEFHTWVTPVPCADEDILRVHTRELLTAVRTGGFADADTPVLSGIFEIAKLAAGGALLAAEHALAGRPAFSLMRPPGHHAERDRVMGFCYLNNLAIAVTRTLESSPKVRRVAILDFDCHHGNGTEDTFRGDERVLFASLHQSPCYPGTGLVSGRNASRTQAISPPAGRWATTRARPPIGRRWKARLAAFPPRMATAWPTAPGSDTLATVTIRPTRTTWPPICSGRWT